MALTDNDRELLELQRSRSQSGATVAGLPSGAAVAADPEVIRTWELRRAAQAEAYGQYVAAGDIYIGNCMTFASGQPVPLEHVIRFNLIETEQVNRIADPEMARLGKVYDDDEAFLAANPHVARQARTLAPAGELHPSALDPRGGGAEIDDARKRGEDTEPTRPGDRTEARQEAVKATADRLSEHAPDDKDDDKAPKARAARNASTAKEGD